MYVASCFTNLLGDRQFDCFFSLLVLLVLHELIVLFPIFVLLLLFCSVLLLYYLICCACGLWYCCRISLDTWFVLLADVLVGRVVYVALISCTDWYCELIDGINCLIPVFASDLSVTG